MKLFWPLLFLAIPLAGCISDQKQQSAACQLTVTTAALPAANEQMMLCMQSAGYEMAIEQPRCQIGYMQLITSPYCYKPMGRLSRLIYAVEMKIERSSPH